MNHDFVHLHVHTEYSLLESGARIETLVQKAKELGMHALAITDSCAMYGVLPFYHACKKAGIKPIIGAELFLSEEGEKDIHKLVLLAENLSGYQNLIKLVSMARLSGNSTPAVSQAIFQQQPELTRGLIAISPMLDSHISHCLQQGDFQKAEEIAGQYRESFPHSFFLEVQDHRLLQEKELFEPMILLSKKLSLPLVATNHVHYVNPEDVAIYEVLCAIREGTTLTDPEDLPFRQGEYYLKSGQEMEELFVFLPDAIKNTALIASRCQVEIPMGEYILPSFPVPEGTSSIEYLRMKCEEGIRYRYGHQVSAAIRQRLDYELQVIHNMGFADYFLIVWDFVKYAREHGIGVGPGRGSAAGSLVAYALQITNIDPIKYHLLFERFLNPERITMPDIDIDFSYERRDEVIEYVTQKYGRDRVAQIITFGTMGARAAVRDVGRVLGLSVSVVDRIAKLIPHELGVTLEKARERNKRLDEMLDENPRLELLWKIAQSIEGMPRHTSIHAAGVVISRDLLTDHVPLQLGHEGQSLTQYTMEGLEQIGLLKMDFLALRNLTIIQRCIELIQEHKGISFDLDRIPLDDQATYEMLSRADTVGVFQLESSGMRNVLKQVQPVSFEEVIAVLALFRPGPMEFIPEYARVKKDPSRVKYLHPDLEPILKDTYGFILYQEQIMQVASKFAGFSLGEADLLRRAVSKKKKELLQEQREKFVAGCLRQGYGEEIANQLYDWIVRFADYGFNRSHSAAYALIAYQTGYLKANYTVYYLTSMLQMVAGNMEKVAEYIEECRSKSVPVLPPDINQSQENFTVENDAIRFGLLTVKNVGIQAVKHIIDERKNGKFKDLPDFCQRVDMRIVNRRVIESLINCGAMDGFPGHRRALLASLDDVMEWAGKIREHKSQNQLILFGVSTLENPPQIPVELPPFSQKEKLEQEKETLGLYVSGHPLDELRPYFLSSQFTPVIQLGEMKEDKTIKIIGMIKELKIISTKKGQPMAFLELEDPTGKVEVVVFPGPFATYSHLLKKEKLLMITGRINHQEHGTKVVAQILSPGDVEPIVKTVFIKIGKEIENNPLKMNALKEKLMQSHGKSPVILYYETTRKTLRLSEDFSIAWDEKIKNELERIVGSGSIVVKEIKAKLL